MKDSRTQNIAESPQNEKMFTCLGPANYCIDDLRRVLKKAN